MILEGEKRQRYCSNHYDVGNIDGEQLNVKSIYRRYNSVTKKS